MDRYATHLAPLVAAALAADGPILELGCGDYSTPVLAEIAKHKGVSFTVMASDESWSSKFIGLCDLRIVDWDAVDLGGSWGCVLLDNEQKTAYRIRHLPKLLTAARAVVVHDLENCQMHAHWPDMTRGFSRIECHSTYKPGTGVLYC